MVRRTIRFRCEKCRKGYPSYDEAWDCELWHITQDAIDGFEKRLECIFRDRVSDRYGEDAPKSAAEGEASQSGGAESGASPTPSCNPSPEITHG